MVYLHSEGERMYNSYLRGLIRNSGLTQKRLASLLHIHPSVISHIVNGIRTPTPKQKQILADYFGKNPSIIFKTKRG